VDEHLFIEAPGAAVVGYLAGPAERVRRDIAESPALERFIVESVLHDVRTDGPADEPADAAVERINPGGSPCIDRWIVTRTVVP
jgi:hypothetical protein